MPNYIFYAMKMMPPPIYLKDCLHFLLAAILFLGNKKICMLDFMNTFMYVIRYFMYHIKL